MILAHVSGSQGDQFDEKKIGDQKYRDTVLLCSTQLPEHQRMNANGNGYQIIYFSETIIQWDTVPVMIILYNCCTKHNNTHSVHNRLLKLWRVRLLPQWPCCYVPSPPLSGANCCPFPLSVGPGPPVSKMAPFSPGSTHTPSPLSATTIPLTHLEKLVPDIPLIL